MFENLRERVKKVFSKKKVLTIAVLAVAIVATIIAIVVNQSSDQSLRSKKIVAGGELARAMTYDQFVDGDEAIDGTDNVKFSAFFLRDINGDGYAEKIKGTCKQIGKEDTLYMEVNVQTDGILKNAKIEIDGKNFYLVTASPKDNELKDNYIGNNIKKIEFNDMTNGTQKLITGIVRSGDYSQSSSKSSAIGSNINNLSRDDNKIIFTGTYVGSDGNEIEIKKEINLQTDWYGTTSAKILSSLSVYSDIDERQNEENGTITLNAGINVYEKNCQLKIKKNYVEGTIPQLNGYDPISVTMKSSTDDFTYDETTRQFTAVREAVVDENGNITKVISDDNYYNLEIVYPLEAYKKLGTSDLTIEIPVMTYYEGYNNPNTEFTNPYKSNEARDVLTYTYTRATGESTVLDLEVGDYMYNPTSRYVVSKRKPLRIYNGLSSEETDDNYVVQWYISKGKDESSDGLIMKERQNGEAVISDSFIKDDSISDSMENLTTNIGIGFSNADCFLADDGFIKVYNDETDELLVTFTKTDWGKYTEKSLFKFDMPVKHIRVETSQTQDLQYFYVFSQKQLDDEYITTNYTREQFDNLKYISSNLSVYAGNELLGTLHRTANYEAPYSIASLGVSKNVLSSQLTEKNEILTIRAIADSGANQVAWTNGSFLIKLPTDIIAADINNVEINNSNVSLTSYEYIENDNDRFIKVNTKNTSSTAQTFEIKIDTNMTPDPRIATTTGIFELWASNDEGVDYYYNSADIYDVNDNLNTEEKVHKSTTSIKLVAPNSLLTSQTASDFDQSGIKIISPQIADIRPQLATVSQDTPEKTVKIGAQIKNNYSDTITDVVMLGKIPFEGNTYVLSGEDLGSEFTTKMTDAGIEVPEALKDKVVVYYSENETPDKDLSNTENGWKTAENVANWDNIKTFLIDFKDVEITAGTEYTFYYTIKVPNGIDYNKKSFSHHGVYFALKTAEGKYRTQIEPNKLGLRIAEKYNLELQKYQTGKTNLVPGATYKITKEATDTDEEESKTVVTDAEGKLELQNLYAKRTYSIEEIKTPENYELNTDVIKIIGTIQENGSLKVEKTQGTIKDEIEITKDSEDEPYKVTIKVEDEAKAKLKIIKTEKETIIPVGGVKFKLIGAGLPESGRNISTNVNGETVVKGLKIGEEYTLEETKATGFYLASPVKFTMTNTDGVYEASITEGETKSISVTEEENLPVINISIDDEKIPTYDLEISKIKKVTSVTGGEDGTQQEETVYLQGARFKLYKGTKELGSYISDENGKITISGLYQYIDGKDEEAVYTLKETFAPKGYAKVKDITFKVDGTTGELKFINTEGKEEKYTSEGTSVKLTIEDSPSFKLIKKDAETGELLANIKFAIYNVESGVLPAQNSNGEIIGTKEVIDGKEYYTVTTNSNGEITADLAEGLYKAVEVQAPDKYEMSEPYYFGIGTSVEKKRGQKITWAQGIGESTYDVKRDDNITSVVGTSDGGYIVGGYFGSNRIELENGMILTNNGGTSVDEFDETYGTTDGLIIKYSASEEIEWAHVIGGSSDDEITSIVETSDGAYIVGGFFNSTSVNLEEGINLTNSNDDDSSDGIIIKYDSAGKIEWAKAIGGNDDDSIKAVAVTSDGGCIIGGSFVSGSIDLGDEIILTNNDTYSYTDGMIIKFNAIGKIEWAKVIGGSDSDSIETVAETSDGGCIAGGNFISGSIDLGNGVNLTSNFNKPNKLSYYTDGMIIKYNANGEAEWAKVIGEDESEYIKSVSETTDGGYIVGGYFNSDTVDLGNEIVLNKKGSYDGMIIKYNKIGETEFANVIGGNRSDYVTSVVKTSDGGYLIGGYFSSTTIDLENEITLINNQGNVLDDGMIIKYGINGEMEWAKKIGGYYSESIEAVSETTDGEYLLGGKFETNTIMLGNGINLVKDTDEPYGMIIKIKDVEISNSKITYGKEIGGTAEDYIKKIVGTRDGGYIVGGYFKSPTIDLGNEIILTNNGTTSYKDGLVIKYSAKDEVEWAHVIGGSLKDEITSIVETNDGGYIIGGYFESSSIDLGDGIILTNNNSSNISDYSDGMIIKYNATGKIEFVKVLEGNRTIEIESVTVTSDGGYLVGGNFYGSLKLENGIVLANVSGLNQDGMIIKYNADGEVEWAKVIGGNDHDIIRTVAETNDGGYIVSGSFKSSSINLDNGGSSISNVSNKYVDGMIIKYNADGEVEWTKVIGGADSNDYITSIVETSDGNYIALGYFCSDSVDVGNGNILTNTHAGSAGMIIKYSADGDVLWAKEVKGIVDGDGENSVLETSDGDYIVVGRLGISGAEMGDGVTLNGTGSKTGVVIKYSADGKTKWAKECGASIETVSETTEGCYIVGGAFYGKNINLENKVTLTNKGSYDGMILKLIDQTGAPEVQELEVTNKRKSFKITTDVEEWDNIKGGSISGEDALPYEEVKYGDSSTKEIKMIPDENYAITGITVNGEKYQFSPNEDGSYTMPIFTDMTEDKHIVVSYYLKDNKITINKIDKDTKEKLSGAIFNIDQIEERTEPINTEIIGQLTDNGQEYVESEVGTEVTGGLGYLTENGDYYFTVSGDGTYIPTNSTSYQSDDIDDVTEANSYIPINLTNLTGEYVVIVNASCSCTNDYNYGYVTITNNTNAPYYNDKAGQILCITGEKSEEDYTSMVLKGGNVYYLHLGYYKEDVEGDGDDQIVINSIKLCKLEDVTKTYNFVNNSGKYESTNQGKANTVANSYIPIDLTNYTGKYNLIVNAMVSSESKDYGYATVTENTTRPSYDSTSGRFIYISGITTAKDYTTVLQGGKMYYLHLGYYKNGSTNSANDKFTINSVNITLNDSGLYHTTVETNLEGQAITQIPFGKYSITEAKAPDGYWLSKTPMIVEFRNTEDSVHEFTIENEIKAKVIVHHYIKGTTTKLADDECSEAHVGDSYTTSPKIDLNRYELEKDNDGNFVLPDNAVGTYAETPTEVIYYYVEKKIPLTVHHYIDGTATQVPLKTGGTASDQTDSGLEGASYVTSPISDENLSDEYELVEMPSNANGTYSGNEVIVTYYYKKVSRAVNLIKYQPDGVTPLPGAKFTIDGQEYVTDEKGKIQVDLEAGTYEVTEIEAPEGYELPENPTTEITITRETTSEDINVINEKKNGTVTVHHYIEGTTDKVPMADGSEAEDDVKTGYVGDIYITKDKDGISDYYELASEPENSSGNYIDGNIEVIYYYRIAEASVLVHHYLEGTTTQLADDEVITGKATEEYTTSSANVDNKYELVEIPSNATGKMTKNQIVVIYYYRVKDTSVLVHHYKEGTTEKVSEDVTLNGKIDDEYATTIADDLPEYYELVEEPSNKTGTMTEEQIVVTYYYRLKKYPYMVNYLEKGTNKVLHDAKTVEDITYGTVINTKDEVIDINGYGYDSADKDILSIAVSGNVINIYYAKMTGLSYTVNYFEKDTDEVLHAPKTAGEQTFEDEIITANEIIDIGGYKYDSADKDKLIIGMGENVINIYYTKRTDLSYKVNYLEKTTNKVLHEQKNQTGMTFKDTVISADEVIDIDGYDYDSVDKDSLTIEINDNVINIYYTKRTDLSYKVNYLEKDTNKVLHDQKVQDGMTFESTVTSANEVIAINGYDYDSVDKETLTITTGENVINIYYTKRTDLSYKVNYLEKDTNKILHDQKVQGGMTFESTVTSSNEIIDIDGYDYDSVDKDSLTITTSENVINVYYTKRTDLSYKVNYLEKTTNKVLHEQKVQDNMIFEDVVTCANEVIDIDGYNYDSVDKDTLTITTAENVINIYYAKRTDLSYEVNYLEKDTNKVLHNQKIQNGMTFEAEVKSADEVIDIDGYKYDSADKETLIITTGANIINIYYTKIDGLNYTVNYLEKGTNKVINPAKTVDGMTFEDVITSRDEIISIDGYNFDSVDKETLTIGTEENVINIYYTKRTDLSYKVNYLEKGTNKVLHDQKVQDGMTFESTVNSSDEVIEIDGYNYDSVDKETLTIGTKENVINIYYTKRNDLSYKVNYLEKDTNKVLHEQKVQAGMTFEDIITSSDEVIDIDGYNYDSVDKDKLTITTGENVINIYYTKRNDLSYKVNYLEKDTNKVLHEQKVQDGMTFESVVTSADEVIEIDGYNYDSVDKETLTITTNENVINIYYTKRVDLSYTVNYLEKDTNIVLHEPKVTENMTFESVITSTNEVIDIDGYNYDSVDKETLTITTGTNVINVYYTKRNDLSYTVNYLEKGTNRTIYAPKVTQNMTFGTEITSSKEVIAINGYSYDSVDKDSLIITTGENIINIYYTKVSGLSYTVNYLEKDTNEVLQAPKTTGDMTFEAEITSSDEVIEIDGYDYDSVDKDTLVIGTGENVINIYYTKRIDLEYEVNYLEKGTNKVLSKTKVRKGMTFRDIVKSSDEIIDIDGYYFSDVDKEILEILTSGNVINIYYVKREDISYTVNYLEKDTNKVLHEPKVQENMMFESVVKSSDEVIDIYGYNYDYADKETLTLTTEENVINLYYTKKDAKVTVHYYEEGTTNRVSDDVEITGKVFDNYETESASDIPSKYELVAEPENKTGTMTEDEITVIYYYRKKATQVIIHYYEEGTDKKLSEDVTINGKVDDSYTTVSADDVPIKYELVAEPVNKAGSMTEETIEVIYYYRVKDAVVNVRYLEKGTNIELADADKLDSKVDDLYETSAKDIDGYQLVEHTGNEKGKFEVEPITITYYYLYKTKATVQYIDKTTGEILEQSTTEGFEGDEFVTESKDFENYVLVEEPAEKTVKMTKEEQVLKYYYIHISGGVIEKHIDVISGQILANAVHEGNEGDAYDIPSRTFDGYDLVEDKLPTNAKGTMKVEPVEVIYYYIYRTKVTAEYIDKNTGSKLTEDVTQNGHEGDNYTTERKTFDGYKLIEVPANADGSMTKEDITVTYYYAHTSGGVIVNHLDVKTNKQLLDETKEEGYEGDPYETHEENISGYDLVKDKYPENATGKMTIDPTKVTYYYIKKTEVNVKYVDKETGEEIDVPTNIPGHEGDDYKTEPKDVPGYDLVEEPENKIGTMTADPIDVIYYYRRPAKVIVNYYDADTKEKLADEIEITGHQNDEYTTEQKDIKYYEIKEVPANKDGKMTVTVTKDENGNEIVEDTTYVNYYYRKLIFNLRVDKTISIVIVNGQETAINGNLGKVEVHRKELSTANVKVVYKIKVTNDSELTGKANVVENIPNGMTMKAENNPGWTINETTASIETDEIKPGESREYQVVLGWQNGDNNIGTKENVASIVSENKAGFDEQFDTDNVSRANLIVAVGTGEVPYVAIAGGVLMIMIAMTAGVYVIKKRRIS